MDALDAAKALISRLQGDGHTAYIAGGWVRDFLMDHPSDDIDIATDCPVETLLKLFDKTIPVGISFGIVIVVFKGHQFEVATFRKDVGTLDGRRPESIKKASPKEDALRRDFTINGMFFDPIEEEIFDFVGGKEDIEKGVIRAIGDPHERFLEDRLRMIRAVRYSARFHFPIEHETMQAIYAHAAQLFPAVAYERVWQELNKMNRFANFDIAITTLHRLELLENIFPALKDLPIVEIESRLRYIPLFPLTSPTLSKLFELFPQSSLQEKLAICDLFRLSNKERAFTHSYHTIQEALANPSSEIDLYDWAKFYADPFFDLTFEIFLLRLKDPKPDRAFHTEQMHQLEKSIDRIKRKAPIIRASDLKAAGIKPGPQMGVLLDEAERLATNEAIDDLSDLLYRLRESPHWPIQ